MDEIFPRNVKIRVAPVAKAVDGISTDVASSWIDDKGLNRSYLSRNSLYTKTLEFSLGHYKIGYNPWVKLSLNRRNLNSDNPGFLVLIYPR